MTENHMSDDPTIRRGVTFFFLGAGNDDDSLDVTSEGISPMLSLDDALEEATRQTNDHGGSHFIIECRVVAKVSRGQIRVTKYGPRK
jgi:hypothetical protein